MALLKLTDDSFTPLGFTSAVPIGVNVDLDAISQALFAATGRTLSFSSLDLTDVSLNNLTATGLRSEFPDGPLIVGDFSHFSTTATTAVSEFGSIVFTSASLSGSFDWFSIGGSSILNGSEDSLTFDSGVGRFDFTRTGTAPLEIYFGKGQFDDFSHNSFLDHIINANDGDNDVFGHGGNGTDTYFGSNSYRLLGGDDLFLGGYDQAYVDGGAGNDLLLGAKPFGNATDEFLNDYLLGGAGNDTLFGGAGDDTIDGGEGDDWLYASQGEDTLIGGAGHDRFLFSEYLLVPAQYATRLSQFTGGEESGPLTSLSLGEDFSFGTQFVEDFSRSEDLIGLVIDESAFDGSGGEDSVPEFYLDADTETPNLMSLGGRGDFFSSFSKSYTFLDGTDSVSGGESSIDNLLVVVEQYIITSPTQNLASQVYPEYSDGTGFDGRDASFEIVYADSDFSSLFDPDVFTNVSLSHNLGSDVVTGGQDKFDLSALGLGEYAVVGGEPTGPAGPVSGIKFTQLDINPAAPLDFSADILGDGSDDSITNFFIDGGLSRAAHIEYVSPNSQGFASLMVYLDIDANGDLDLATDMAFLLEDVLLNPGAMPSSITAEDLYNPTAGTGIFIFHEDQRSFWFENVTLEAESNTPPEALPDNFNVDDEGQNVLANDTDADGDTLIALLVDGPVNGSLNLNLDGTFTYLPNEGFDGTDSFTYRATDGKVAGNIATVTLFETIIVPSRLPLETATPLLTAEAEPLIQLTELYIAYFDRAPDASGLEFWLEQFAGGTSLQQIAAYFYDQPETRLRYPDGDSADEFIAGVYANVLGRAPDGAGQAFWAEALASGEVTRDQFVLEVLRGARAETGSAADTAYLEAKTTLGLYFAVEAGLDNGAWGVEVMQRYDGSENSLQAALRLTDDFAAQLATADDREMAVELTGIQADPQDVLLG